MTFVFFRNILNEFGIFLTMADLGNPHAQVQCFGKGLCAFCFATTENDAVSQFLFTFDLHCSLFNFFNVLSFCAISLSICAT